MHATIQHIPECAPTNNFDLLILLHTQFRLMSIELKNVINAGIEARTPRYP